MVKLNFIGLSLLILLLTCCKNERVENGNYYKAAVVLEKQDYIDWCRKKENPLKKTKELQDITFSLKYKPAEYVACMEESSGKANTNDVKKNAEDIDGLDYYDFKIQITSGQGELLKYQVASMSDYDSRVNYFAFGMEKDIKMIDGSDTLGCVLFHFERAYDVIPYATFLLAFPKGKSPLAERTFIYEDKVFNKGIIKFTYTTEDLSQIPK